MEEKDFVNVSVKRKWFDKLSPGQMDALLDFCACLEYHFNIFVSMALEGGHLDYSRKQVLPDDADLHMFGEFVISKVHQNMKCNSLRSKE